jgi:hypothetical protein
MFTNIFGTMVEVKQIPMKDMLESKKYMVMCRWMSEIVARIMSRLPSTVTRYMENNSSKRTGCKLGSSEILQRTNSISLLHSWAPCA